MFTPQHHGVPAQAPQRQGATFSPCPQPTTLHQSTPLASVENVATSLQQLSIYDQQLKMKDEKLELMKEKLQFREQELAAKNREIEAKDSEITSLKQAKNREIEAKDNEITSLKQLVAQGPPIAAPDSASLAPPFGVVAFQEDMDLDTVSASKSSIKFGMWMKKWVETKSLVENRQVVPDKYMFRLWLGVPSPASQNQLSPEEIDHMFWMLRAHKFGNSQTAPSGNRSIDEKRRILSRFTGFQG